MAIKKINREEIIKSMEGRVIPKVKIPSDYKPHSVENNELNEVNKKENNSIEYEESDNTLKGEHKVDDMIINFDKGIIIYEGDKSSNLIKIGIPERNIDTGNIMIPLSINYKNEIIEKMIPRQKIYNRRDIIGLSAEGASVNEMNAKYHIKAIEYQEQQIDTIKNRHSELGYYDYQGKEVFKLYDGVNIESKYDGILAIKPKGMIDDYLKYMKNLVVPYKNISLAFALGASSAVVARLNKANTGITNLLVHIVNGSSKGKSTATMLAISIWGNPTLTSSGLYNTWNRTENALLTSLVGNYGLAYALDELSMTSISDLGKTIYKIAEGKDKDRLTKEIELRKSGTWSTTIISNGEASILDKTNKNEGIDIRVLELSDIAWTENAEHSNQLQEMCKRNYGVFGHSFAEKLLQLPIEELKVRFENEKKVFLQYLSQKGVVDNKIQRTSSKNAIVTLTASLISEWYSSKGINLDVKGIREILVQKEIESIQRRGIDKKAEEWLLQQVEANASKFRSKAVKVNTNTDYWGTIDQLKDGRIEVAILRNKFEDIMKQGNFEDTKIVIKRLKEEGKLDYEVGRDTRKRKINKIQTPVYVIRIRP